MSETPPMPIGTRLCKDCRVAVPPQRIWRCGDCLQQRIDRIMRRSR
jgi:hypothetical protein